jgi:hypothetical protein
MDVEKQQLLETYLADLAFQRKEFDMRDMTLRDDSPHPVEYVETGAHTANTHAGQMKLMLADEMSIMQGLLHISSKSNTKVAALGREGGRAKVAVVVAGAAPGNHFWDLSRTFGFVDFHLYDPAPRGWYPRLTDRHRPQNVRLYKQYFTDLTAQEWTCEKRDEKGYKHVIFLSDLRSGNGKVAAEVAGDMELQKKLTETIDACYSVLKFRPPYHDDTNTDVPTLVYFDGTIYLQGYPPRNSTETRLHVTDTKSIKSYDIKVYQNQLFYHNQVTRNKTKVLFGAGDLRYDDAHSRFVKKFLLHYLGGISERDEDNQRQLKFGHDRIRALAVLLQDFKCLVNERP